MSAEPKTILIVDDDASVRDLMRLALSEAGYRVIESDRVDAGFLLFRRELPDLAVLDINLPDGTGIELCQKIRKHTAKAGIPVIVLTARGEFETKSEGVSAGADQYLVKPAQPRELLLWVESLLKRAAGEEPPDPDVVNAGSLTVDAKSHIVRIGDQVVANLTGREFDLLFALVKNRPRVLSRKEILSKVWKTVAVDNAVDVHIGNLRQKLPDAIRQKIQSIPGRGFRFLD
ncbi:MAG: response regulator transcription factor [Elusimicrobia bacterium]|nr:response regulator transcription factor [Elusimicrobiota bacterium]